MSSSEFPPRAAGALRRAVEKVLAPEYKAAHFAAAFTEWDRRYRADPEAFANAAAQLLMGTPETYGEAAAPYFMSILDEVSAISANAPARKR